MFSNLNAGIPMSVLALLGVSTVGYKWQSMSEQDWIAMPDGKLYHKSCVHLHDDDFTVERLSPSKTFVKSGDNEAEMMEACPYSPRQMPAQEKDSFLGDLTYYSDWSVYAQSVDTKDLFSEMSSKWIVPPAPKTTGPAGLSSVYIFNGLEDGSGHHGSASLILQPVLQYGKSGCLNDPLLWKEWHLTAYLVDGNGRAHCGKRIRVYEGEEVYGGMKQLDATSNKWETIATRLKTNETSTYTGVLGADKKIDAAYVTLEGMIIYACTAYPQNDGIEFTDNTLADGNGKIVTPSWTPEIRHSECNQHVDVEKAGNVKLAYNSSK